MHLYKPKQAIPILLKNLHSNAKNVMLKKSFFHENKAIIHTHHTKNNLCSKHQKDLKPSQYNL